MLIMACQYEALGQSQIEQEVLDVEKQRFLAMVDEDVKMLNEIISEDLHYIHSNGSVDTKKTFIGAIENGKRSYDDITIETYKVRVYHNNTAIINAECIYHRKDGNGNPNNLKLRYTDVYVKTDQGWKFVAWQSFKIVP